jgi:hypothetical protein
MHRFAASLCVAGVVVAIGLLAGATCSRASEQPSAEEAARRAGSLDNHARALIDQASETPVTLGIRAVRRRVSAGHWQPTDERIVFRLPAGAFSLIDFDDLPRTNQRIGWTFWSRTLDPVRPDTEADRAACVPTDRDCLAQGRVAARRNADEYVLRVEVTGVIRTEENRQRVLWGKSGMREGLQMPVHGPCAYRHDSALDLLATQEPHEASAAMACGLMGFVGRVTSDGRRYRPANFLKLEPDGTARFVVQCEAYIYDVPDRFASYCELQGYLGIWPLFMWVPSNRAAEWDETFDRVRDHLARHIVARSDQ